MHKIVIAQDSGHGRRRSRIRGRLAQIAALAALVFAFPATAVTPFHFSTGAPDGRMATASRPANAGLGQIEIESADDFILNDVITINHATFTGLLPSGAPLSTIQQVSVEIYRVFPKDSTNPPSGHVPTRANSPSDVAFAVRDAGAANLTWTATVLTDTFNANNSVVNGIHQSPNQTTGGEGPVTGREVSFDVIFTSPIQLPADHYFFVPKVGLSSGTFLWLSTAAPVAPDLQSWIRDANLAPDWLRIGTDIVGGVTPPTFNASFSLDGQSGSGIDFNVPTLGRLALLMLAVLLIGAGLVARRRT